MILLIISAAMNRLKSNHLHNITFKNDTIFSFN